MGPFDNPKHFQGRVPPGIKGYEDLSGFSVPPFMIPVQMESAEFDILEHRCDAFGMGKNFLWKPNIVDIFSKVVQGMVDKTTGEIQSKFALLSEQEYEVLSVSQTYLVTKHKVGGVEFLGLPSLASGQDSKLTSNDMEDLRHQGIIVGDENGPAPDNIIDQVPHLVNAFNCK